LPNLIAALSPKPVVLAFAIVVSPYYYLIDDRD
jgi:hypothetical protein